MKPHSSYHASGQHHQKSFGHKAMVRQQQKPDANFRGTVNVVTMGIASDETRAIQMPYQKAAFMEMFEILFRILSYLNGWPLSGVMQNS
jgi:hypothetical protein